MRGRNIIVGQKIDSAKAQVAKEMRRRMTKEEQILWQALRTNRLNGLHFRRQQVIGGFVVDFYCHASGLVVEVDSPSHERQADYDAERDRILSRQGLRVLRVSNEAVNHELPSVLALIAARAKGET